MADYIRMPKYCRLFLSSPLTCSISLSQCFESEYTQTVSSSPTCVRVIAMVRPSTKSLRCCRKYSRWSNSCNMHESLPSRGGGLLYAFGGESLSSPSRLVYCLFCAPKTSSVLFAECAGSAHSRALKGGLLSAVFHEANLVKVRHTRLMAVRVRGLFLEFYPHEEVQL